MVNFEQGLSVRDFKTRPLPMLRADTAMYEAGQYPVLFYMRHAADYTIIISGIVRSHGVYMCTCLMRGLCRQMKLASNKGVHVLRDDITDP